MATHNRAGEITLKQIGEFTYEITITTFTYTLSAADRSELDVQWGDNTRSVAPRYEKITLPNYYYRNKYRDTHTYPGPGVYEIVVQDPNRNYGVQNIPNSVNVIFSIKTTLMINPDIGKNSTPVLLNPPIDKAALNHVFIHNPSAFDSNGDSISYKLTVCTEEDGKPIENYTLPAASDTLFVDPRTGDLVWDSPVDTGIFNIAIDVEEWRKGVKIGNIVRDMQIEVHRVDNDPPVNGDLRNFCVQAGELIRYNISASDPDGDRIIQSASGGPFIIEENPARYDTIESGYGTSTSEFFWQTSCAHVRTQPYTIIVKSEDINEELRLVDIDNFNIKVIGPPPGTPVTTPASNTIRLEWGANPCEQVTGYEIYRHNGPSGFVPDSCTEGIKSGAGFELIGTTSSRTDTSYTDNNQGNGLVQGNKYCYRIVAVFSNGAKSFPSGEACDILVPGTPAVLQASVEDPGTRGEVKLSWAKPRELDTVPDLGPFEYRIYRSDDLWGNNLQIIHTFSTSDLNDTVYLDTPLDTERFPYSYQIELYNDAPGNRFLIGNQEVASTTYPALTGMDNRIKMEMVKNVPWINTRYTVYRLDPVTLTYDSVASANMDSYTDSLLVNGKQYCYRVKSYGWRQIGERVFESVNWSHPNCATPLDTVAPCPPELEVTSLCDSMLNRLVWTNPNHFCADDVVGYNIYYSPVLENPLALIDSLRGSAEDTTYLHAPEGTMAGCYAVTAIDSFRNESDFSLLVCVDECTNFDLPNVFTPNGDGINDFFRPTRYSLVEKVDMKIFNRWGNLVFETTDPDINWDGKHKDTGKVVPPGVYYYVCDVYENRLTGLEVRNVVGFVHIYTEKGVKNAQPEK